MADLTKHADAETFELESNGRNHAAESVRSLCIECNQGVASNRGFIYDPGGRNLVVCDSCIYSIYGVHKGFLAPSRRPAGEQF